MISAPIANTDKKADDGEDEMQRRKGRKKSVFDILMENAT